MPYYGGGFQSDLKKAWLANLTVSIQISGEGYRIKSGD